MYAKNFSIYSMKTKHFLSVYFKIHKRKLTFFKMSDFYNNLEQKSTEDIYQYANRLYNSWLEERKSANQCFFITEKFFIMVFISGLGNDQVRSKMNKWLKENSNPEKLEAISCAYGYQSEEDEIYQSDEDSEEDEMYLPDYVGVDQNNNIL